MAFRYRREGQFTKFRVHFDRSGFRPYIDELKWEIMDWHYQRALGPRMKKSLMSYQAGKVPKSSCTLSLGLSSVPLAALSRNIHEES